MSTIRMTPDQAKALRVIAASVKTDLDAVTKLFHVMAGRPDPEPEQVVEAADRLRQSVEEFYQYLAASASNDAALIVGAAS